MCFLMTRSLPNVAGPARGDVSASAVQKVQLHSSEFLYYIFAVSVPTPLIYSAFRNSTIWPSCVPRMDRMKTTLAFLRSSSTHRTFQEQPAFPSRRFHHLGSLPEELAELVPEVGHIVALDDDRVATPAALFQP